MAAARPLGQQPRRGRLVEVEGIVVLLVQGQQGPDQVEGVALGAGALRAGSPAGIDANAHDVQYLAAVV